MKRFILTLLFWLWFVLTLEFIAFTDKSLVFQASLFFINYFGI